MPTFEFKSPEGKTYSVSGPEGATKEQAWEMLQRQLGSATPDTEEPAGPSVTDKVKDVAKQAPSGLLEGIYNLPEIGSHIIHGLAAAASELGDYLPEPVVREAKRAMGAAKALRDIHAGREEPKTLLEKAVRLSELPGEKVIEQLPQPQTPVGQITRSATAAVPATVAGGAGVLPGLAAGAAGEGARQLAEGTGYENTAALGGSILGGGSAVAARPVIRNAPGIAAAEALAMGHGAPPGVGTVGYFTVKSLGNKALDRIAERFGVKGAEPEVPGPAPASIDRANTRLGTATVERDIPAEVRGPAQLERILREVNESNKPVDPKLQAARDDAKVMNLLHELAQQNKGPQWSPPNVTDFGRPWATPEVVDMGPIAPWRTPSIEDVTPPTRPSADVVRNFRDLQRGLQTVQKLREQNAPTTPEVPASAAAPVAPPASVVAPAAEPVVVKAAKALRKATKQVTPEAATPKAALETATENIGKPSKAADNLDIPEFLRRTPDNKLPEAPKAAAQKAAEDWVVTHDKAHMSPYDAANAIADQMEQAGKTFKVGRNNLVGYLSTVLKAKNAVAEKLSKATGADESALRQTLWGLKDRAAAQSTIDKLAKRYPEQAETIRSTLEPHVSKWWKS